MKNLIGCEIKVSIVSSGLLYRIDVSKSIAVEIVNSIEGDYEMSLVPPDDDNAMITEPAVFDSLIDALTGADDLISEIEVKP